MEDILKKAEKCAKDLGVVAGTWYVVKSVPVEEDGLSGYFLMTPQPYCDDVILIDIEKKSTYYANTNRFLFFAILGVVRDGKADKKVWT